MLDIGWSELLVIAIVAIVVVGPKELPRLMRTVGFYAGKLRRAASDFQRQFEEAMRESEADEVRKNLESIRSTMAAPVDQPVMRSKATPSVPPPAAAPVTGAKKPKARKSSPKPSAPAKPKAAASKPRKTKAEAKT